MSLSNSQEVFEAGLQKAYYGKQQAVEAQQALIEETTDGTVKSALENHKGTTQSHVGIIENIFEKLGLDVKGDTSKGLDALLNECQNLVEQADGDFPKNSLVNEAVLKLESLETAIFQGLQAQALLLDDGTVLESINQILADDQAAYNEALGAASALTESTGSASSEEEASNEEESDEESN
jgi:ferritin-like metal-binding protein YciE